MAKRADLAVGLLLVHAVAYACGQSAFIDWSRVSVDVDGEAAAFGPQVIGGDTLPVEAMQGDADGILGFYANSDGFYGREHFTEYVAVRRGSQGRLEALKIVGDANVPRGKLTWRTAPGVVDAPTYSMAIQLQLRDNPEDPQGFWWSDGHNHEVVWEDERLTQFSIVGQNPAGTMRSIFSRVSENEAREAASLTEDAP